MRRTIRGTYGSEGTPCMVLVYGDWYVVEGGCVVNRAADPGVLKDGVWVEEIEDIDCFTWPDGINCLDTLVHAVNY